MTMTLPLSILIQSRSEAEAVLKEIERRWPDTNWLSGLKPTSWNPEDVPNVFEGYPYSININYILTWDQEPDNCITAAEFLNSNHHEIPDSSKSSVHTDPNVLEYLKGGVRYDEDGVFITSTDGERMIATIRGWGEIQYMFLLEEEAAAFQDKVGKFIAAAINEKIEREKG